MQQDGNQASAQQDVSDSCHQAEGTNFVFFCHSDSGYSYNWDLHVAHLRRSEAGALSSLSSLSLPLTHQKSWKKTSMQHLRAMYPPLPVGAQYHFSPHWTRLSRRWCVHILLPLKEKQAPALKQDRTSSATRFNPCFFINTLKSILALLPCSVPKWCEKVTHIIFLRRSESGL